MQKVVGREHVSVFGFPKAAVLSVSIHVGSVLFKIFLQLKMGFFWVCSLGSL